MTTKKELFDRIKELQPECSVAMQAVRLIDSLPYEALVTLNPNHAIPIISNNTHCRMYWEWDEDGQWDRRYLTIDVTDSHIRKMQSHADFLNNPDGFAVDLLQSNTIEWPESLLALWKECYDACIPVLDRCIKRLHDQALQPCINQLYPDDSHVDWETLAITESFLSALPESVLESIYADVWPFDQGMIRWKGFFFCPDEETYRIRGEHEYAVWYECTPAELAKQITPKLLNMMDD